MSTHSDLALTDADAEAWFTRNGWNVESRTPPLQVFTDRFSIDDFLLSRIWHTPLELTALPDARPRTQALIFIPLVGHVQIETADLKLEVTPGEVVALHSQDTIRIITTVASAYICVGTSQHRLPAFHADSQALGRVLEPEAGIRQTLVATITASLNTPLNEGGRAVPAWRRGVEQLLDAMLITALEARNTHSGTTDLLSLASRIVTDRAADPDFSVAELTSRLNVSTSQLHRSFSSSASTPGELIRATRLSMARRLLDDTAQEAPDSESIARSSGFTSARSMRRAFVQDERKFGSDLPRALRSRGEGRFAQPES